MVSIVTSLLEGLRFESKGLSGWSLCSLCVSVGYFQPSGFLQQYRQCKDMDTNLHPKAIGTATLLPLVHGN